MKVLDVEFKEQVKFPTNTNGAGKNKQRMLIDHPVAPEKDFEMHWVDIGVDYELVITHVGTKISVGVPRSNVAWCRPSLSELIAAKAVHVVKPSEPAKK